jgi:hypothetical protein
MGVGDELLRIVLSCEAEIIGLIQQQAEWEIPLHAILYRELERSGHAPLREDNYRGSLQELDMMFFYGGALHALEIKVESASRPGHVANHAFLTRPSKEAWDKGQRNVSTAMTKQVGDDIAKVSGFELTPPKTTGKLSMRDQRKADYLARADPSHDGPTKLVMLVGYTQSAQEAMRLIHEDAVPTDFGQGKQSFKHEGARGGSATGAKLTVGVYYAEFL